MTPEQAIEHLSSPGRWDNALRNREALEVLVNAYPKQVERVKELEAKVKELTDWISVEDRLPEDEQEIFGLVDNDMGYAQFPAMWDAKKGVAEDCFGDERPDMTHWLPQPINLPE